MSHGRRCIFFFFGALAANLDRVHLRDACRRDSPATASLVNAMQMLVCCQWPSVHPPPAHQPGLSSLQSISNAALVACRAPACSEMGQHSHFFYRRLDCLAPPPAAAAAARFGLWTWLALPNLLRNCREPGANLWYVTTCSESRTGQLFSTSSFFGERKKAQPGAAARWTCLSEERVCVCVVATGLNWFRD